jgi:hypothetical protein
MRGEILHTDVGLNLDDAPDATTAFVLPNEPGAEERSTRLERRLGEQVPRKRSGRSQAR